jgi:hypothetical protein
MDRKSMTSRTGALFIVTIFLAQMYAVQPSYAEPLRIESYSLAHESYRAVSLPETDRLSLISVVQVKEGEEILGTIAAYDNSATLRPNDYLELYNNSGALLAVSWFDEFGIERLAVDRAVTQNSNKLEGVFVLLITDDSI